jgi:hypothetical protein
MIGVPFLLKHFAIRLSLRLLILLNSSFQDKGLSRWVSLGTLTLVWFPEYKYKQAGKTEFSELSHRRLKSLNLVNPSVNTWKKEVAALDVSPKSSEVEQWVLESLKSGNGGVMIRTGKYQL